MDLQHLMMKFIICMMIKNRLDKVLPQGANINTNDILYYYYLYHEDDQIYKKKIPSKDEIIYLYNDRGLMSIEQDGNMKANDEYFCN